MLKSDNVDLLHAEIARLRNTLAERDEEIIQFRKMLIPPEWEPPVEIGLTTSEARIIACLYKFKTGVVSKDHLYFTLYHDRNDGPEPKIVDVYVCKLRRKIAVFGIEVHTIWGRGYHLDEPSIKILDTWGIDPNSQIDIENLVV